MGDMPAALGHYCLGGKGMQASGQPVSISWLQSPDARDRNALLEYTRGVLYSLAFAKHGDTFESRAIHAGRIRSVFNILGAPELYRVGLTLLHVLREVEPLFGGYWLLTPFRVVEIESLHAFVGSLPSTSGKLGDVQHKGLGRFISADVANKFPRQAVSGWMGLPQAPIATLVAEFISNHRQLAAPTIHAQDIEYFKVIGKDSRGTKFIWSQQPNTILPTHRVALCRQKRGGMIRHFSGELRAGRLTAEAPLSLPLLRLMFALANSTGLPMHIVVRKQGPYTSFRIPERLPAEERRLALMLAKEVLRQGGATSYSLESHLAPPLFKQLSELGCAMELQK